MDDQPNNLIALEAVLSGPDYNLITAQSGEEAIALMQARNDIALVLLDVQMPGMDGFEAAKRIKAIEQCRDIPIIFITAIYREDPFIRKGYEAGAIDYFSKPFDPEVLKMKVNLYCAFHQKAHLVRERERRLIETEELLKTGQKLSGVLETLPVGVLIADAEGRVCQVNEEVTRIWCFESQIAKDAYGQFLAWWDNEGQLLKSSESSLIHTLKTGESTRNELARIKCFDGSSKTVLNSASPLRNLEGEIVGAVMVIQDVTAHTEIQHDMQNKIHKLISLGMEFERSARM